MAAIIFDFDGTLADTQRGIVATAQEVMRRMGLASGTMRGSVARMPDTSVQFS